MKKEYKNYLVLIIIGLILLLFPVGFNNIFGSSTDWVSQHTVFPEYFRNLFYSTGKIIPNFAMNLGAGQNIFNFSYYGLLSPIILISYLLPFVKMADYIVITTIITIISSACLLYKWLRNNNIDKKISLISSIIFLCSSPIIFHAHRHIMFINYMPFLILGLIGIDKYFNNNKKTLLTISIFLMIMTSYYYSVGGMFALVIYGIYKYLEKNNFKIKQFLIDGLKFSIPFIIAVMMSAVILLPTIYVIKNSGDNVSTPINLIELLPRINTSAVLYDAYSLGLTSIAIFALINNLFTKNKKFLTISILIIINFPIFIYLLNGGLYVRPKVLIPFLPLIILIISKSLLNIDKKGIYAFILISILILLKDFNYKYLIDSFIIILGLVFYSKKQNKNFIIIPTILICLISALTVGYSVDYMKKNKYDKAFDNQIDKLVNLVIKEKKGYYRMNNLVSASDTLNKVYNINYYQTSLYSSVDNYNYRNFYFNIFNNNMGNRNNVIITQNNNILFKTLMGVKYVISKNNVPGYKKIQNNDIDIYENEHVFPLGYASNIITNNENVPYPYNIEYLLNSIVVNKTDNKIESTIVKRDDLFDLEKSYEFDSLKKAKINLKQKLNNEILFIRFKMNYNQSCNKGDTYITINGVNNKLSCKEHIYHNQNFEFNYVIYEEELQTLDITFSKGKFNISDIEIYTMPYESVIKFINQIDKFNIEKIHDNYIKGNIEVTNDGYFATTIPYDEGFKVYVDEQQIDYEKVNNAFLGFKINKGYHKIRIEYHSPYLKQGIYISILGFAIFTIICYQDIKKHNN